MSTTPTLAGRCQSQREAMRLTVETCRQWSEKANDRLSQVQRVLQTLSAQLPAPTDPRLLKVESSVRELIARQARSRHTTEVVVRWDNPGVKRLLAAAVPKRLDVSRELTVQPTGALLLAGSGWTVHPDYHKDHLRMAQTFAVKRNGSVLGSFSLGLTFGFVVKALNPDFTEFAIAPFGCPEVILSPDLAWLELEIQDKVANLYDSLSFSFRMDSLSVGPVQGTQFIGCLVTDAIRLLALGHILPTEAVQLAPLPTNPDEIHVKWHRSELEEVFRTQAAAAGVQYVRTDFLVGPQRLLIHARAALNAEFTVDAVSVTATVIGHAAQKILIRTTDFQIIIEGDEAPLLEDWDVENVQAHLQIPGGSIGTSVPDEAVRILVDMAKGLSETARDYMNLKPMRQVLNCTGLRLRTCRVRGSDIILTAQKELWADGESIRISS